jgi:hypothetical protein
LGSRSWVALTVLAIIVPISFVVSFQLTGLWGGTGSVEIAETITLETLEWGIERPDGLIDITDSIVSIYDGDIKLTQTILTDKFSNEYGDYGGSALAALIFNVTAYEPIGHVQSLKLTLFEKNYPKTKINILNRHTTEMENLSISESIDWAEEVSVELDGISSPNKVYFRTPIHWVFYDFSYNQTHLMEAASEVTYYNGSTYNKIAQRFILKIGPDDNNSFQTADEIHKGNYTRLYLGNADIVDFYKFYVVQGQRIRIYVDETFYSWPGGKTPKPHLSLYLYDPEKGLVLANEDVVEHQKSIDIVADSAGYWFIEIRCFDDYGFYYMEVDE